MCFLISFFYAYNLLGEFMHIIDRIRNFYGDNEYFIGLSNNDLYILNYESVSTVNQNSIVIVFSNFKLLIEGKNFIVTRKNEKEINIKGTFFKVEKI